MTKTEILLGQILTQLEAMRRMQGIMLAVMLRHPSKDLGVDVNEQLNDIIEDFHSDNAVKRALESGDVTDG